MEKNCRVRIARDGVEFEAEGDKKFVVEMLDRFESKLSQVSPKKAGTKTEITITKPAKAVSVREFIQKAEVKKHTDKVIAFGYYLEKYSDLKEFTPADINNCYYEAKMETSNTSQIIIQNIKRGFMMEAKQGKDAKGARKKYTLTHSGEEYILNKINNITG